MVPAHVTGIAMEEMPLLASNPRRRTMKIFKLDVVSQNVVSHLSFVGKYDGPFPFYSEDVVLLS